MLIGYARTSTVDQLAGFEAQKADLIAVGCDARRMFVEQISSVAAQRPQLTRMLDQLRPGDVVVVTKLDRLARSMTDLIAIVGQIEAAGASLRILAMQLDTSTATGKLMLNVLGSVAAFERDMMLERQRIGIAQAKARRQVSWSSTYRDAQGRRSRRATQVRREARRRGEDSSASRGAACTGSWTSAACREGRSSTSKMRDRELATWQASRRGRTCHRTRTIRARMIGHRSGSPASSRHHQPSPETTSTTQSTGTASKTEVVNALEPGALPSTALVA